MEINITRPQCTLKNAKNKYKLKFRSLIGLFSLFCIIAFSGCSQNKDWGAATKVDYDKIENIDEFNEKYEKNSDKAIKGLMLPSNKHLLKGDAGIEVLKKLINKSKPNQIIKLLKNSEIVKELGEGYATKGTLGGTLIDLILAKVDKSKHDSLGNSSHEKGQWNEIMKYFLTDLEKNIKGTDKAKLQAYTNLGIKCGWYTFSKKFIADCSGNVEFVNDKTFLIKIIHDVSVEATETTFANRFRWNDIIKEILAKITITDMGTNSATVINSIIELGNRNHDNKWYTTVELLLDKLDKKYYDIHSVNSLVTNIPNWLKEKSVVWATSAQKIIDGADAGKDGQTYSNQIIKMLEDSASTKKEWEPVIMAMFNKCTFTDMVKVLNILVSKHTGSHTDITIKMLRKINTCFVNNDSVNYFTKDSFLQNWFVKTIHSNKDDKHRIISSLIELLKTLGTKLPVDADDNAKILRVENILKLPTAVKHSNGKDEYNMLDLISYAVANLSNNKMSEQSLENLVNGFEGILPTKNDSLYDSLIRAQVIAAADRKHSFVKHLVAKATKHKPATLPTSN